MWPPSALTAHAVTMPSGLPPTFFYAGLATTGVMLLGGNFKNIGGVARANLALNLLDRAAPGDRDKARGLLCLALADARRLRIPEAGQIEAILQRHGLRCDARRRLLRLNRRAGRAAATRSGRQGRSEPSSLTIARCEAPPDACAPC